MHGQKNQGANPRQVVMTVTNSDEKRMRWNFICNLRIKHVPKNIYKVESYIFAQSCLWAGLSTLLKLSYMYTNVIYQFENYKGKKLERS